METLSKGSNTDLIATLIGSVPVNAALKACKDAADLTHLEQAISLLREILDTSSERGTPRLEVLNLLVMALLTRFNYDPQSGDMGYIITLQAEIISLAQDPARGDSAATLLSSAMSEHYHLAQNIITSVRQSADVKLLDEAVSSQREALLMQPQGHERVMSLVALADALCLRFNHGNNGQDLAESIALLREAHQLHHNHAFLLMAALLRRCNLDGDLRTLLEIGRIYKTANETDKSAVRDRKSGQEQMVNFHRLNEVPALHYAIRLFRQSIHHISFQHEERLPILFDLSKALLHRYSFDHNPDDLDQAIRINQNVLLCRPQRDKQRSYVLTDLGAALLHKFERAGDPNDIDNAIVLLDEALELIPPEDHDRLVCLDNLSESFLRRFGYRGSLEDADKAVAMAELALDRTENGDSHRPHRLDALGQCLSRRYEKTGCAPDLAKAIGFVHDAVNLLPSGHPQELRFRTNLSDTYLRGFNGSIHRSNTTIDLAALDKSISDLQSFIAKSDSGHPDIPRAKGTVGAMLLSRFEDVGHLPDITTAVSLLVDVIRDTPDDDSYKPNHLHKLGRALTIRFYRNGQISDIDEAISVLQRAIQGRPYKLPDDHVYLLDLGAAFAERFAHLGVSADIDEAIAIQRRVVAANQPGQPQDANPVASLGCWLLSRFVQTKSVSDVDEAVATLESAMQIVDDDDEVKPDILMNLATSLENRSKCRHEDPDIEKWIQLLSEAVRITSDANPAKPGYLNNLGNSYLRRFEHLHNSADVDEAISAYDSSLRLIPQDHPSHPATQFNLGRALSVQLERGLDLKVLEATISQFSSAALSRYGLPRVRLQAASRWTQYAWKYDHPSVLQASAAVLDLLPRVAWLGLPLPDRHKELIRAGDLMNAVAAICIERGDYVKSVEWLEQGRSIVWGQILQMRSPVDELRNNDSDLAKRLATRFEQITRQLQTSGLGMTSSYPDSGARHRVLVSEWEDTIGQIRAIDGFQNFLSPKKLKELVVSDNMGPIVVLNISTFRCDALIVIPHPFEVRHVPLPNFSFEDAQRLRKSLYDLLKSNGRNILDDRLSGHRENAKTHLNTDQEFESILSELWLHVVQPILPALELRMEGKELPRVWWCPTGPATFLPIHAAGLYDMKERGHKITDFAVSSYTPTIGALVKGSHRSPSEVPKLLTIAQPYGQSALPGTLDEIVRIEARAKNANITSLLDSQATVKEVLRGMTESHWVHFACHGVQNKTSPTDSSLILANEARLKLSDIIGLALPHPELAFLSACQTATGYELLSEEAIHLAAGMLLAGYHGVVATMWSIVDREAPQVAEDFYERLCGEERADHRRAAHALHYAVERLRDSKGGRSFLSWVPFVHMGV